jgi:DNA helicase-2/ATP-dependent DNA helicase PcrA
MGMVTANDLGGTICAVADENQRLDAQTNSSIQQIRTTLSTLGELPENALTRNYRNTKEIAALASCFYVGLQSGIATPPEQSGPKPCMSEYSDVGAMVQAICTHAKNNPGHSILVILDRSLKKCFNKIKYNLQDTDFRVEGYKRNKDKRKSYLHGGSELHTGDKGTLACVHWRSMKGLEADAVFVPEFEEHNMGGDGIDAEKMRLYVMFSRARQYLEVQYKKETSRDDRMLTLMRETAGDTIKWRDA